LTSSCPFRKNLQLSVEQAKKHLQPWYPSAGSPALGHISPEEIVADTFYFYVKP